MSTTVLERARLVRALIVLATVAAVIGGLARIASSAHAPHDAMVKPPAPPMAEGQLVAEPPAFPDEPAVAFPEPYTVPASASTPAGVSCAEGWSWFENPVMHYGFCVPPGWGFTDFTTATPMSEIPSVQLEGLHLVNTAAFPWRPGDRPFDVIRRDGIIDVELVLLEPGMTASTECEPSLPRLVAGLTLLTCEQAYDALGLPAATGMLRAQKIAVPLLRAPEQIPGGPDLTGAKLLVIARTSLVTPLKEVEVLWKLVDSIRPL